MIYEKQDIHNFFKSQYLMIMGKQIYNNGVYIAWPLLDL